MIDPPGDSRDHLDPPKQPVFGDLGQNTDVEEGGTVSAAGERESELCVIDRCCSDRPGFWFVS
jgi:hypothetical protein